MDWTRFFIIFLSILSVCSITYTICRSVRERVLKQVQQTSERFLFFSRLPVFLAAEQLSPDYYIKHPMKSKRQLDRINFDHQIMGLLATDIISFDIIQKGVTNQMKEQQFFDLIQDAPSLSQGKGALYSRIELKETEKLMQQARPVVPMFCFTFYYISPQGRNYYEQTVWKTLEEILHYWDEIRAVEENKRSAKYQRSILSDSIRYDVLKRDGFHCVLCGAGTEDGVKLHVDHIRPIAKGGKTELPNLRTLCERCNSGKRDKYDEQGVN